MRFREKYTLDEQFEVKNCDNKNSKTVQHRHVVRFLGCLFHNTLLDYVFGNITINVFVMAH